MNIISILLIVFTAAFGFAASGLAQNGNVWLVDKNGAKHFTCPVMKNDEVVGSNTKYSDHNGQRYYFCCPGCKPAFEKNPEIYLGKMVVPGNIVKAEGDEKQFVCPVSGETAPLMKDTEYSDHQGKRYYFCCAGCIPKFEAEPEKYLEGMKKNQ